MFGPSIVIVWILIRLMDLKMLSVVLPLAISDIRATNVTSRMPGPI